MPTQGDSIATARTVARGGSLVPPHCPPVNAKIRPIDAQGHTPGHTAFHVSSGKDQLIVLGDTTNIPALFVRNPGWHAAFDQDAAMPEATRRKLLDQAAADQVMVTGYHFPFPAVGTIAKDGKGYAFKPA